MTSLPTEEIDAQMTCAYMQRAIKGWNSDRNFLMFIGARFLALVSNNCDHATLEPGWGQIWRRCRHWLRRPLNYAPSPRQTTVIVLDSSRRKKKYFTVSESFSYRRSYSSVDRCDFVDFERVLEHTVIFHHCRNVYFAISTTQLRRVKISSSFESRFRHDLSSFESPTKIQKK